MNPSQYQEGCRSYAAPTSRREFLARYGYGLGAIAATELGLGASACHASISKIPHFAPKAKRVIFLFQSGGPSHLDLFDDKPGLNDLFDQDLPDSIRQGQRITGMVSGQSRLAVQPTKYKFARCGQSGLEISDLLPHTRKIADEICLIRSMHTEAINHDPAITFIQTGNQIPGRPCIGAWLDYGLGSVNENLPSFVVMNSVPSQGPPDQGLLSRLWGAGFLPSRHQGVLLRSGNQPVLYLSDPKGISRDRRRNMLDTLNKLNQTNFETVGDPEIETRIAQYEMAFRMQSSIPDLVDLKEESQETLDMYGEAATKPGTFARNCLLARRMAERGVRFVQLYHRGWDHHNGLDTKLPVVAHDVDQASSALILDLKQRGLLDETLVIWGGEFGRTVYAQGNANRDKYGRDHHGRAFSIWMAGGGIRGGMTYGQTDDFGFNIVENPVHVRDFHATLLHLLGINHQRFTAKFQGLDARLTGVEEAHVLHDIIA